MSTTKPSWLRHQRYRCRSTDYSKSKQPNRSHRTVFTRFGHYWHRNESSRTTDTTEYAKPTNYSPCSLLLWRPITID